eukprot:26397-Eustigmatos_ZCMA.PRE.1
MATKQMVRIELPKHYSTRSREDLLAGPESVDIRERSPFFYEVSAGWNVQHTVSADIAMLAILHDTSFLWQTSDWICVLCRHSHVQT